MSDKYAKDVRKQLRTVAKELLPEVMKEALAQGIYEQLRKEIQGKLTVIEAQIKATLEQVDQRNKDIQAFIMRQMADSMKAQTERVAAAVKAESQGE